MTRGCACFQNCAPEPAPVSILNATTNVYSNGALFNWKQEKFTSFTVVNTGQVTHPVTGAVLAARWSVSLARVPVDVAAVKVYIEGTARQRPLIAYTSDVSTGYDYFIVDQTLYLNFDLAAAESLYVEYVGLLQAGDSASTAVGSMDTVAIAAALTAGWVEADGITPYSKLAYKNLYDWFKANDPDTIIEYVAGEANTGETYDDPLNPGVQDSDSGKLVPPGAFVIRYLSPETYAALPEPDSGYRVRDTVSRVVVKA